MNWTSLPASSNPGWIGTSGTAYDALDRPTASYAFPPNSAVGISTTIYDAGGRVATKTNPTGDMQSFSYDSNSRPSQITYTVGSAFGSTTAQPTRTYTYDPDGRVASVNTPWYGTQTTTYTPDGLPAKMTEGAGGLVQIASPATYTYHYYPNDMRASLDVASAKLTQTGLKSYSYRNDGLMTKLVAAYGGKSYAFGASYSAAGRLITASDPLSTPSLSIARNAARPDLISSIKIPEGSYSNFTYDQQDQLNGYTLADGANVAMTFSPRDELTGETVAGNSIYTAVSADGYMYQNSSKKCTTSASGGATTTSCTLPTWAFDSRSNAPSANVISTTTTTVTANCTSTQTNQSHSSYIYDLAGRRTDSGAKYDVSGHMSVGLSGPVSGDYIWGVNDHPIVSYSDAYVPSGIAVSNSSTLHWDGNDLLFMTNSANGLTQINLTSNATLTIAGSNPTLSIFDRDPSGAKVSVRNATGHDSLVVANPYGICDNSASSPHVIEAASAGFASPVSFCHANGAIWTKTRIDGYFDGKNMFRGVCTYSADTNSWTSSDQAQGTLSNPISQLPYTYAENNPISKVDPSGFYTVLLYHPVWEVANLVDHAYLLARPDDQSAFSDNQLFDSPNADFNSRYTTLSGEPSGSPLSSNLISDPNADATSAQNGPIQVLPPVGVTDTEYINDLLDAEHNYSVNTTNSPISYDPTGGVLSGYNSNSYASGLIHATGGRLHSAPSADAPGWSNPVPDSYFEPHQGDSQFVNP